MKKQVAVLLCAISFDNQGKILEGIVSCAKKMDINIFVFTCHISYTEADLNKQGAFKIMDLPELSQFDGVIVVKNTIQYERITDKLMQKVKSSGIPMVCVDEDIMGMDYVGISSYQAQRRIMEHIIRVHRKRNIFYVTGQLTNREGKERYEAYCDVISEEGILYDEKKVFYGYYDIGSGRMAVKKFLEDNIAMPEAIICANDSMALGVISQLNEMGYRVPEDVLVTGFDADEIGLLNIPSITTIDRNQRKIGYEALRMVMSGGEQQGYRKKIVPFKMICGHSCGCPQQDLCELDELKKKYVSKTYVIQQAADSIKNMASEFAGLESTTDLYEVLKTYVVASDMQSFYLCMCDASKVFRYNKNQLETLDLKDVNTEYSEKIEIPIAYENRHFVEYDNIQKGEIIPTVCKERSGGNLYIVTPVYYQNCCFGYCVSGNSYFPLKSELFYSWVMNIGVGLENIRKWMLLNETVKRLNGMWVYDMLTHIYNRAGFFHYSEELLKELVSKQAKAFIIFIDIDGLKYVNDNLGHDKGDMFIKGIAGILKESLRKKQLLIRYGGDEFVIFGESYGELEVEKQILNIKDMMLRQNETQDYPFVMDASIGCSIYNANEIKDLNELIEIADKKMYEEKREKKRTKK